MSKMGIDTTVEAWRFMLMPIFHEKTATIGKSSYFLLFGTWYMVDLQLSAYRDKELFLAALHPTSNPATPQQQQPPSTQPQNGALRQR